MHQMLEMFTTLLIKLLGILTFTTNILQVIVVHAPVTQTLTIAWLTGFI